METGKPPERQEILIACERARAGCWQFVAAVTGFFLGICAVVLAVIMVRSAYSQEKAVVYCNEAQFSIDKFVVRGLDRNDEYKPGRTVSWKQNQGMLVKARILPLECTKVGYGWYVRFNTGSFEEWRENVGFPEATLSPSDLSRIRALCVRTDLDTEWHDDPRYCLYFEIAGSLSARSPSTNMMGSTP